MHSLSLNAIRGLQCPRLLSVPVTGESTNCFMARLDHADITHGFRPWLCEGIIDPVLTETLHGLEIARLGSVALLPWPFQFCRFATVRTCHGKRGRPKPTISRKAHRLMGLQQDSHPAQAGD